jgi:hypothetical protein
MGAICSSLRGSRESWYPLVTTLGGMRDKAKGAGIRHYRRAKRGNVARCKTELGESGRRATARLNEMYRREVRCGCNH